MRIQAAAVLILAACSNSEASVGYTVDTSATGVVTVSNMTPSDWSDTTGQWKLVQVANLEASDDTAGAIVSPSYVTVDGAEHLLVLERSPLSLRMLELDGTFILTVGREGAGPGEYRNPIPAAVGPYLVVDDPELARLTVYDSAGALLETYPAPCCYWAPVYSDDSNHVYMQTSASHDSTASAAYVRINVESGATDTVMLPRVGPEPQQWEFVRENSRSSYTIPFQPSDITVIVPSGHVVRGWSGRYEYLERTFDGDSLRVVRRQWQKVELPDSVRRERYEGIKAMVTRNVGEAEANKVLDLSDVPAEAEPMRRLYADGAGNVWVPVYVPGAETLHYDIFSPEGVWRGTLVTPWSPGEFPVWLGDDEIVTKGNSEEGYPFIRVWRVER
ncbi:MAG TPA: hypothetical protein VFS94_12575 [Gemmatimonadales bacterium]|nr:hypothetical protein [Gemmatimonadales bacterium]